MAIVPQPVVRTLFINAQTGAYNVIVSTVAPTSSTTYSAATTSPLQTVAATIVNNTNNIRYEANLANAATAAGVYLVYTGTNSIMAYASVTGLSAGLYTFTFTQS
jgi:hypothetical protein